MPQTIEPIPGDPATEPVATAEQSHVNGRVGPPTIAQDETATDLVPDGVTQYAPGLVLPADTPRAGGKRPDVTEPGPDAGQTAGDAPKTSTTRKG